MNILSWNIRGLNHPLKQKEVRHLIKSSKIDLVCLLETKVREHNILKVANAINPSFAYFDNHSPNMAARILLLWDSNSIHVQILATFDQAIFCYVNHLKLSQKFFATFVYASNDRRERENLWSSLIHNQAAIGGPHPWLILGDFNVVLKDDEKKGGNAIDMGASSEFKDCLEQIEAVDLRFSGCLYTWSNKQMDGLRIYSKLDRALVNEAWLALFPDSEAYFPPSTISDHSPIIINSRLNIKGGRKPFKFFNYWTKHKAFQPLVEEEWSRLVLRGSPLSKLFSKLKALKFALKAFNNEHYGALSQRVAEAKLQLEEVQREVQNTPIPSLMRKEEEALNYFMQLSLAEEAFYKQKARDNSIRLGDQNTSFFHRKVRSHCSRNKIVSILNQEGDRIEDYNKVKMEFIDFYKKLLGTPADYPSNATAYVAQLMSSEIPNSLLQQLDREVTGEEVRSTLFSLPSHKAPGPDGYTSHFFKETWSLTGEDVTEAIRSFFALSKLPREVNSTSIALVPKVPNPSTVKDFRPISCCSTIYKCISKILANRLKQVMPHIISPTQAAFVKGRTISDQILLMQELVRNYHRKKQSPRCALKIDLMKAFDSVSWDLLVDILHALNLPPLYIGWIKECITTPYYSLSMNGALEGYFPGAKGLRQGDPLSPYLFLLAMEFFTRLFNTMIKEGDFSFHPKCSNPSISHICFADDLFILCTPNEATFHTIRKALLEFHKYSGLLPNKDKSKAYLSGVAEQEKTQLCSILGFQLGTLPVKYLGVPLITTKLKFDDCKELIEKVTSRVSSWTSKCLSYAGRLVLVKSVLHSIQVYWSIHFIFPKKVIEALESILRRFLWSGAEMRKWGSKVAWREICLPKKEGGLGIRSLHIWNKASMLRHLWAICSDKLSLWVTWCKENLLKGKCFWEYKTPSDCSWTWRKLLKLREEAVNLSHYEVGNGQAISLWFAHWHSSGPLIPKYGPRVAYDAGLSKDARVSIVLKEDGWKWPYPTTWELKEIVEGLPTLHQPNPHRKDKFIWAASKTKTYNAQATWEALRYKAPQVNWHSLLWFPKHIPRHSFILWLALRGKLNTKDKLVKWGMNVDPVCVLCAKQGEDLDHLLFQCSYTAEVRKITLQRCFISKSEQSWRDEVSWAVGKFSGKSTSNTIRKMAWSAMVYHIWKERNSRVFKGIQSAPLTLVKDIGEDIVAKLSHSLIAKNEDDISICNSWGIFL